ncbi:MAG: hypothetical protein LBC26_03610 [Oscillospiraceae bacterium]|jgi:hypothetical protein|nr:hypothetical protein [Oscillospiraceae bacterium]
MKRQASMQGSPSILIILIMLSLSAFGVLAMMSAYSDYKLAEKNTEWARRGLVLETQAQESVGRLDAALAGASAADFARAAEAQGWEVVSESPLLVSRDVSDADAHLRVELALNAGSGPRYRIRSWRQWQDDFVYDDGMNVWDGT